MPKLILPTAVCVIAMAVPVVADPPETVWQSTQRSVKNAASVVIGRQPINNERAKAFYRDGDQTFREASELARGGGDRKAIQKLFKAAAKQFRSAAEASEEGALTQDAIFMRAESHFFADELVEAADLYQGLQKNHPRNRHSDAVSARLFTITQYWIDTEKAGGNGFAVLNLFDETRPTLDADGHAIRVLDQIRYDDPTGRLADDATMAAAAEYLRQGDYEMADEMLTDLRETFPESEHFFMSHLLAINCKMKLYAGPRYSRKMLVEAEKLVAQTRRRFPSETSEPQTAEILAATSAEIAHRQAEHLVTRATYREKKREFRAARQYYEEILEKYPNTRAAEVARMRLTETESLPPAPGQRLGWLTRVFPDSSASPPLEPTYGKPAGAVTPPAAAKTYIR